MPFAQIRSPSPRACATTSAVTSSSSSSAPAGASALAAAGHGVQSPVRAERRRLADGVVDRPPRRLEAAGAGEAGGRDAQALVASTRLLSRRAPRCSRAPSASRLAQAVLEHDPGQAFERVGLEQLGAGPLADRERALHVAAGGSQSPGAGVERAREPRARREQCADLEAVVALDRGARVTSVRANGIQRLVAERARVAHAQQRRVRP